jgi:hypothetical protein
MHPDPHPGAHDETWPSPPPAPDVDEDLVEDQGDVDDVGDDPRAQVGAVVDVVHLDAAGERVVRPGQVVDVVDDAVVVAYFGEVSHPIPLDHTVHGRDDAVRVELHEA